MGATALYGCATQPVNASRGGATAPVKDVCELVERSARISREQLSKLIHIAEGNSSDAMRDLLGLPYCWVDTTEYFPMANHETTWIGITYDDQGIYRGFSFSANNYGGATNGNF